MSPRQTTLGWIVWAVAAIGAIWFFLHECSGQTKGDGARALLRGIKQPALPPMPSVVIAPRTPAVYLVAVQAILGNNGSSLDQISYTNTSGASTASFSWNPIQGCTYNLFWGRYVLSNCIAGITGTQAVIAFHPPPLTNLVLTFSDPIHFPPLTNPSAPMMLFTGVNLTITRRYF